MGLEIKQDLQDITKLVHLISFLGEMVIGEDLAEYQFIQSQMEKGKKLNNKINKLYRRQKTSRKYGSLYG